VSRVLEANRVDHKVFTHGEGQELPDEDDWVLQRPPGRVPFSRVATAEQAYHH
jgi:hypothetical protein